MKNINFRFYKPGVLISLVFLIGASLIPVKAWLSDHWSWHLGIPTVILFLLFLIDRKLWHYKLVRWSLMTVPDMRGTYKGRINYENEPGNPGSLECELTVRQTASDIWVESRFMKEDGTLSSPGRSETAHIVRRDTDTYGLVFTYINEGGDHLSTHRGTNDLDFRIEDGVKKLSGRYYNNRRNKGTLDATEVNNNKNQKQKP